MQKPQRLIRLEQIIANVANVTVDQIMSESRAVEAVEARQVLWTIAYDEMHYSYPAIAKMYDRNHTTIMHGVAKMRDAKTYQEFIPVLKELHGDLFEIPSRRGKPKTLENWKL